MRAIEDITLEELIPQRPPFVMIDRLVSCDTVFTVTELEVRPDNVFVENGRLTPSGMVENMAQTCAARIGYISLNSGEPVRIGVIGAVDKMAVARTPKVGERLATTVKLVEEVFQVTLVEAVVRSGDEELARCKMKIALTDMDSNG